MRELVVTQQMLVKMLGCETLITRAIQPFDRLLAALRRPYDESADNAIYAEPAPAEVTAGYRTFCGT